MDTSKSKNGNFALDIEAIRKRARDHIKEGAVTGAYRGNRETIIRILNDALATELVCVLRYKRHQFMSGILGGIAGFAVTKELAQHAAEEEAHAAQIAERIVHEHEARGSCHRGAIRRHHTDEMGMGEGGSGEQRHDGG